jgi:hypothetical protein
MRRTVSLDSFQRGIGMLIRRRRRRFVPAGFYHRSPHVRRRSHRLPDLPSSPRFQSAADQPDDGLLNELKHAQVALGIAEYHLRLWRANSVTGNVPFRVYRAYAAHEAVHEAGGIIDRIAEMLRIEVSGTLETPRINHSSQVHNEAPPTGHAVPREWVAVVRRVDSGGAE